MPARPAARARACSPPTRMNCLMEVLGMALPYNGTALAKPPSARRWPQGRRHDPRPGRTAPSRPRDIVTAEALDDAFALDMAMGGITNTVLHTLAIAHEAGLDYPLERINAIADRVPHLCKVSPAGSGTWKTCTAPAAYRPSSTKSQRATGMLHLDRTTVTGSTLATTSPDAYIHDEEVIRPAENAHSASTAGWRSCLATWRPKARWLRPAA